MRKRTFDEKRKRERDRDLRLDIFRVCRARDVCEDILVRVAIQSQELILLFDKNRIK